MSLPQFWVKSEGSLKSGWHGLHCGEMIITQNWTTTVLIPQIWVTHSKLREIKTPPIMTQAFTSQNINLVVVSNVTKCSIICIKNLSVLLFDNTCVVAVMYFNTVSQQLVYNINFILYLSHYPLLSIYSRRANQIKKILCITLSRVLGDHRLKLFITD